MSGTIKALTAPIASTEFAVLLRSVIDLAAVMRRQKAEIPQKIAIAVSGGIDSMALAHLTRSLKTFDNEFSSTEFMAMIVDHGLRQDSDKEADKVEQMMDAFGLRSHRLKLDIPKDLPNPTQIELIARKQRYKLFAETCNSNGISHLVTGHHGNDQAETVLMRLIRDSGNAGLAGMQAAARMPECEDVYAADQIMLLRPFLGVFKNRLKETLIRDKITWFEDPTNADVKLTPRNSIRSLLSSPESSSTLPAALHPESLISFSERTMERTKRLNETVDWWLSHCFLRHVRATGVIECFIPRPMMNFPTEFLGRVLSRLAEVVSPLDRIDMRQMVKVAENILSTTDPSKKDYNYINNVNEFAFGNKVPQSVKKDYRHWNEKALYGGGAITENNIFWEAVYCRSIAKRPDGVMLCCYRQPYLRAALKRPTDTPEFNLDIGDPNQWFLWDGRFWLRYTGTTGEGPWTRLKAGKIKRVFVTGTRKEVMYRLDEIGFDLAGEAEGKALRKEFKKRCKSEAPGKSKTVLPVLCEEVKQAVKKWKVPYRPLGFPTFSIGTRYMGDWEWKPKKDLVIAGQLIGNIPTTAKDGKTMTL
ncbi:hypothetical protein ABW20_dc0102820 [Dactylellina cionopaga]|nr:hypothetical protein ABW20_dc0102820 [Dactylellina cionopaga]